MISLYYIRVEIKKDLIQADFSMQQNLSHTYLWTESILISIYRNWGFYIELVIG